MTTASRSRPTHLDEAEAAVLLRVARDGLEAAVRGRPPTPIDGERTGKLREPGACFVTLHERGQLRGCIGALEPFGTLAEVTRAMAEGAALRDPRFRPVEPSELDAIDLSVSVLTPARPLRDASEWQLGRDGLIVSRGMRRGVLLPQVASDHGWDFETFLGQTCVKAGLPPDAWRDPDTRVEVFSAEVYE
jgi:AmmeMemoRadiSam system protein A